MNPYVYSRSRRVLRAAQAEEQAPSEVISLLSVVKSAFTSAMSPAIAFAMVLFAAGAVGGISLVAYSEMSSGNEVALVHVVDHKAHPQVLGDSTVAARVGQLVYNSNSTSKTIYLVGQNGLYGFTGIDVFNSWGYTFSQIVPEIASENALPVVGTVPLKQSGCDTALNQIAGSCPGNSGLLNLPTPTTSPTSIRVGQLINKSGTVYLVGQTGLYGFPSLEVFQSWGFTFSQIVTATDAENALSQIGLVTFKQSACNAPLDQILGKCGSSVTTNLAVPVMSLAPLNNTVTAGANQQFNFLTTDNTASTVNFTITWGDNTASTTMPGQTLSDGRFTVGALHTWTNPGSYIVNVNVTDTTGAQASNKFTITVIVPTATVSTRTGQIINLNGTVYLVGSTALYGFPDLTTFQSWGYAFSQILTANSAEQALTISTKFVPAKVSGCNSPLDQIAGSCGTTAVAPTISSFVASPSTIVAGQSTTLSWTSTGAATCGLSWSPNVPAALPVVYQLNSSLQFTPPQTTTYTLSCTNSIGTTNKQVTVTVASAGVPSPASNAPVIIGAIINSGVLTVTGTFSNTGSYYVYVNGQGFAGTLQGSQLTSQVGIINGSLASVQVLSTVYGSSNIVTASVLGGSSSGSGGGSNQTASLTVMVNGGSAQSGSVTVNPGDTLNYQWSASSATSSASYYTVSKADSCGNSSTTTQYPWFASTPTGSLSKTVLACQAGVTYNIVFTAPGYNSTTLSVTVGNINQKISGIQGLDVTTNAVTASVITPGKYMVIYGSFVGSGDVVSINGAQQSVTSDSPSQINVSLPLPLSSLAGTAASVVVANGSSISNTFLVTVSH